MTVTNHYQAALDAIPAHQAALDKAARIDALDWGPVDQQPGGAVGLVADQLADLIDSGKTIPDDIGERVLAAEQALAAASRRGAVLQRLRTRYRDEAARAIEHGADDALAVLAERAAGILAAVRDLAPRLGDVRTTEQAAQAGGDAEAAWLQLTRCERDYSAVRDAQRRIYHAAERRIIRAAKAKGGLGVVPDRASIVSVAAEMARLDAAWPNWQDGHAPDPYKAGLTRADTAPPWDELADPCRGRYTPAYLLWAAHPDRGGAAGVWVPGIDDLVTAWHANITAANDRRTAAASKERRAAARAAEARGEITHRTHPYR